MRVVITHRAIDLAGQLHRRDLLALTFKARYHIGDLLAQRGGRGALAVGTRKHRLGGLGVGKGAQRGGNAVQAGQQHLAARLLQHQAVAEVIDVFAGAGKVHEFQRRTQLGVVLELLLDEVFHRLDVMVGGALDLLDPRCMGNVEAVGQGAQALRGSGRERRQLGDARLGGQCQQPFDFDLDPRLDQAVFGEDRAQRIHFGGVAAVERGQGEQGGIRHGQERQR